MKNVWLLPAMLIIALFTGVFLPRPGEVVGGWSAMGWTASHLFVVLIFIITGLRLPRGGSSGGSALAATAAFSFCWNLLAGPAIAVMITTLAEIDGGMRTGLLIMSVVPTTLSSCIVITRIAGGNSAWAVMFTLLLSLAGIFVLPFTLKLALDAAGDVSLPAGPLLLKIIKIVLLPLAVGWGLQRWRGRGPEGLRELPSIAVAAIVWLAASRNSASLLAVSLGDGIWFLLLAILLHGLLLAGAYGGWRMLRLQGAEGRALLFVASQKTLPLALTVLVALPENILPPGQQATAAVVCIVCHLTQLLLDSTLAGHLGKGN